MIYRAALEAEGLEKKPNKDLEANEKSLLLTGAEHVDEQNVSRTLLLILNLKLLEIVFLVKIEVHYIKKLRF